MSVMMAQGTYFKSDVIQRPGLFRIEGNTDDIYLSFMPGSNCERKGSYFFERAAGEAEFYSERLVTRSHTLKANTQWIVLVERSLEGDLVLRETLSGISSVSFKKLLERPGLFCPMTTE